MYSQKSCIFECSLNFAIRTVGCLPWDFPIPTKMKATDILVCHSSNEYRYGKNNKLIQFFNAMKNQTILRNCSCLPDCETIAYDTQERKNIRNSRANNNLFSSNYFQVASNPLNPESLCNDDDNPETRKMAFKALTQAVDPLALTLSEMQSTISDKESTWNSSSLVSLRDEHLYQDPRTDGFTKTQQHEHCLDFFRNGAAKLTIEFINPNVMKIKRDTRLTLMDQVGILGNT